MDALEKLIDEKSKSIKDGYSKYLLTMDKLLQKRSGIKHLNILDILINYMINWAIERKAICNFKLFWGVLLYWVL